MKTMLDILKENLPAGAEFVSGKEKRGKFLYTFTWLGHECSGELVSQVAPGYEKKHVIQTICSSIAGVYLDLNDIETAKIWMNAVHDGRFPEIVTGRDDAGYKLYTFEMRDVENRTITIKMPAKDDWQARRRVVAMVSGEMTAEYTLTCKLVGEEEYR